MKNTKIDYLKIDYTSAEIQAAIKLSPHKTVAEISRRVGVSTRTVQHVISRNKKNYSVKSEILIFVVLRPELEGIYSLRNVL